MFVLIYGINIFTDKATVFFLLPRSSHAIKLKM